MALATMHLPWAARLAARIVGAPAHGAGLQATALADGTVRVGSWAGFAIGAMFAIGVWLLLATAVALAIGWLANRRPRRGVAASRPVTERGAEG